MRGNFREIGLLDSQPWSYRRIQQKLALGLVSKVMLLDSFCAIG
jgi:hypothetical protein